MTRPPRTNSPQPRGPSATAASGFRGPIELAHTMIGEVPGWSERAGGWRSGQRQADPRQPAHSHTGASRLFHRLQGRERHRVPPRCLWPRPQALQRPVWPARRPRRTIFHFSMSSTLFVIPAFPGISTDRDQIIRRTVDFTSLSLCRASSPPRQVQWQSARISSIG